jgi:hypothetical protein
MWQMLLSSAAAAAAAHVVHFTRRVALLTARALHCMQARYQPISAA